MCDCDKHRKKGWTSVGGGGGGRREVEIHIKRTDRVIAGSIRKATRDIVVGGISPVFWGARVWKILHDLAELTDTEVDGWQQLMSVLPDALPCPSCARHMREWVSGHPVCEDGARHWMFAFHNAVNERLGRPVWTEEQLTTLYRDVDLLMMGIEFRGALEEISGILSTGATCQMLRMLGE
jgi:hypothetical protein